MDTRTLASVGGNLPPHRAYSVRTRRRADVIVRPDDLHAHADEPNLSKQRAYATHMGISSRQRYCQSMYAYPNGTCDIFKPDVESTTVKNENGGCLDTAAEDHVRSKRAGSRRWRAAHKASQTSGALGLSSAVLVVRSL